MDAQTLRQAISIAGGPEFIVGFIYDNTGRTLFTQKPFELSMIEGEFIKVPGTDTQGTELITLKPIETIQSIICVKKADQRHLVDTFYLRS